MDTKKLRQKILDLAIRGKPTPYVLGAFTADGHPTAIMEAFTEN